MHTRRTSTLPVLSLALPRPQLPRRQSATPTPQTPRTSFSKPKSVSSPRTSSDSWGSYSETGDDDRQEWSQENVALLARALDVLPSHMTTPFHGPVPPSNFLDRLAREIVDAKGPDWPHSIRATRVKLLELARNLARRDTIREEHQEELYRLSIEESKENVSITRPLYRQSSMDFLPKKIEMSATLGRLSSRLQRTDRIVNPGYHPYPRPASRSPSPPLSTADAQATLRPHTRSQTLRTRALTTSAAATARPPVRRVASVVLSHPPAPANAVATGSQPVTPIESSAPSTSTLGGVQGTLPRMRRTGSFNAPANPTTLKRAPSYAGSASLRSVATVASALARVGETDAQASSDEEEKARQRKSKRARTGVTTSVEKGTAAKSPPPPRAQSGSPRTRSATKTAAANAAAASSEKASPPKPAVISPKDKAAPKLRPKHRRSPSFFGDELPFVPAVPLDLAKMPFPAETPMETTPISGSPAPAAEDPPVIAPEPRPRPATMRAARPKLRLDIDNENHIPASQQQAAGARTLRRSRMTTFPTRRISFSNFVAPANSDAPQPSGSGLQSAIQLP